MAKAKVNPVQLQKFLKDMDYPVKKQDILKHSKEHGADEKVRSVLDQIPDDTYETPADVNQAVGKIV